MYQPVPLIPVPPYFASYLRCHTDECPSPTGNQLTEIRNTQILGSILQASHNFLSQSCYINIILRIYLNMLILIIKNFIRSYWINIKIIIKIYFNKTNIALYTTN